MGDGVLSSSQSGAITAELRWLGADRVVPLKPSAPGMWKAVVEGPQVRALGVELWRQDGTRPVRVSQGLEMMPAGDATLSWAIAGPQSLEAWRLSRPVVSSELRQLDERRAMMAIVWLVVSVLVVLALARKALARSDGIPVRSPLSWWKESILWGIFAVAWTWPAIAAGPHVVGRHFDALGTVWVIDAATRLGFALFDALTVWPSGVTYSAIDSWVLLPLAWLGSRFDAAAVHGWVQVVGVAASAFAASRFAREVGAKSPYDLVAGICFMGSGLAASALLEGHVYQVVNPWMPLMGLFLWRCAKPTAKVADGIYAALFFSLCLFTSGYIGLSAGLLGLGLGLPALILAPSKRPILLSGVLAMVVGYVYIDLFTAAQQPGAANASMEALRKGSLALTSLGPPSSEVDRAGHSWALVISAAMIALSVVAWRMRTAGAVRLWATAMITVFVAMGPQWALGLSPDEPMVTSPLAFLWEIEVVQFLRWPGRLMWAALLAFAVLASVGVSTLAQRLGPRVGGGLLLLMLVEAFVVVGLPFRQRVIPGEIPEVYNQDPGAVFDLVGQGINQSAEMDSWINATLCQYQTVHSRSISKDCLRCRTGSSADLAEDCAPQDGERADLNGWVTSRLYEGNVQAVMTRLRTLNFTSLAVHFDWIRKSDRMRIAHALANQEARIETETAEGVHLYPIDSDGEDVVLPDGPPKSIVGPTFEGDVWSLRTDLVLPPGVERGRYFLSVDNHPPLELRFMGGMIASINGGAIFAGHFNGPAQNKAALQLYRIQDGVRTTLWSGDVVPLDVAEDLISFRLDSPDTARPMLRSLDAFSPEIRHRGGKIIGLGWLGVIGLLVMWWVGVRRLEPDA